MQPIPADPEPSARQRLLDAAAEVFMAEGYRASLDRIAAHAHVARQTLYNHFHCKEALFDEVIRNTMREVLVTLEADAGDLRPALVQFAGAYRQKVLGKCALATLRALAAETPRCPELGRSVLTAGPEQTAASLARFLDRAMTRGELRRDDPRLAAELLIGMLTGYERVFGLLDAENDLLADPARGERVVDCFLRAYRPE